MLAFLKYNLWAILWGLLIVVLTVLPGQFVPKLPDFMDLFQPDKLVHVVVYCIFYLLQQRSFKRQPSYPWLSQHAGMATLVITVFLGSATEMIQHYAIPGRTGSLYDFIANVAGCLLGYLLAGKFRLNEVASNGRGN